jgi:hypothetical protein
MKKQKFLKDEKIIKEDSEFKKIYIILEGMINCYKNGKLIKTLENGDYFGEMSALLQNNSLYTYTTESNMLIIYELDYDSISSALGDEYRDKIIFSNYMNIVSKAQKFLNHLGMDSTFNTFKLNYYATNNIVYNTNQRRNKKITIILSGVLIQNGKIVAKSGDIFGEYIVDSKTE